MAVLTSSGRSVAVVINRDRTTAVTRESTNALAVRDLRQVHELIERTSTIEVGAPGVQGPAGPAADADFIDATVDAAVSQAVPLAVADAIAQHVAAPDPHPGYLDEHDLIDGGNF